MLEECRHHFFIEPPNGPVSRGICKLCGAAAEFLNSLGPAHPWEGGVSEQLAIEKQAELFALVAAGFTARHRKSSAPTRWTGGM
jgi:hypothetical protein